MQRECIVSAGTRLTQTDMPNNGSTSMQQTIKRANVLHHIENNNKKSKEIYFELTGSHTTNAATTFSRTVVTVGVGGPEETSQ